VVRGLVLAPFTWQHLHLVEPWFLDAETQRWLGGPGWPRQALERAEEPLGEFRGAVQTGQFRWLAWHDSRAVGYIDCGTYDRWTTWDPERGVVATIPVASGAIAYVVDPGLRGRGYATLMISHLTGEPEVAGVELFGAGVEPSNVASVKSLLNAGFEILDPQPDFEGIVYYALRRDGGGHRDDQWPPTRRRPGPPPPRRTPPAP
jgi:ribosomal protein S18 acetylase RimI-like enzyme